LTVLTIFGCLTALPCIGVFQMRMDAIYGFLVIGLIAVAACLASYVRLITTALSVNSDRILQATTMASESDLDA